MITGKRCTFEKVDIKRKIFYERRDYSYEPQSMISCLEENFVMPHSL